MKPKGIVVHHSAGRINATVAAVDKYHREKRGFKMIGYHYVIRKAANGWQCEPGRPEKYRGAHCRGKQDHLGFCIFGNYEEHGIDDEALECLIDALVEKCYEYGWSPKNITYHRQHKPSTLCPGRQIIAIWDFILMEVTARLPL